MRGDAIDELIEAMRCVCVRGSVVSLAVGNPLLTASLILPHTLHPLTPLTPSHFTPLTPHSGTCHFEAQSASISNDASCNDPSPGQPSLNEPSPEQPQQPEPDDTVSSNDLSHHQGNNEGDVAEQSNESAAEGGVSNESPQSNEVGAASRSKLRRQVTHSKSLEKEEGEGGGAMWAERELVVAALQQREEMQREVAELRADRELLLSRVRILEEERETLLVSERGRSQVGGVATRRCRAKPATGGSSLRLSLR